MKFNEYDVIRLLVNLEEDNVFKGEIGTVLMAYTQPKEAYEVEINNEDGTQKAQFIALPEQLEKI